MKNEVINLYDNSGDGFAPSLTTYIIDNPLGNDRLRAAVMVIPGGGYKNRSAREAEPIALQFNAAGLCAFVLNYRVAPFEYCEQPLEDAAAAMRLIRNNAEKWGIDPEKIAVCGFSAGGHLAACLCAYGNGYELDEISAVPNAA